MEEETGKKVVSKKNYLLKNRDNNKLSG